jgi:hypothetical protein
LLFQPFLKPKLKFGTKFLGIERKVIVEGKKKEEEEKQFLW